VQDCLGALNDATAHRALCASIAKEAASRGKGTFEIAYIAGVVAGREEGRGELALNSSQSVYRRFAKFKPFWR
jgi:hypothetical protein